MTARTLDPELLHRMDAYWRAANYLSVGQIYLYDNPLLRRPLALSDVRVRASPPHQPRRRDCGATTSPAGAAAPQVVACTRPREAPPAARARRAATAHPPPHTTPRVAPRRRSPRGGQQPRQIPRVPDLRVPRPP